MLTPRWMDRLWRFCKSVIHYWGLLATGGAPIGAITFLQGAGYWTSPLVIKHCAWTIAVVALFIAFFRVWSDQANIVETVTEERKQKNYQKCAQVIENINCQVVDVERDAYRFVFQDAYLPHPNRAEAFNKINETLRDFYSLVEKNGIFLPQNVCDMLKTFIDTLSKHVSEVGVYTSIVTQQPEIMKKRTKVSIKAFEVFDKTIPVIRKTIEHEFRKILGVENPEPESS